VRLEKKREDKLRRRFAQCGMGMGADGSSGWPNTGSFPHQEGLQYSGGGQPGTAAPLATCVVVVSSDESDDFF
jgi:hypothetical protein